MDKEEKHYSGRIKYENIPKHESKSLDYLLPEWIMNLRSILKKDLKRNTLITHELISICTTRASAGFPHQNAKRKVYKLQSLYKH